MVSSLEVKALAVFTEPKCKEDFLRIDVSQLRVEEMSTRTPPQDLRDGVQVGLQEKVVIF